MMVIDPVDRAELPSLSGLTMVESASLTQRPLEYELQTIQAVDW
jgi:hypothetical protein